jgi:hypothetical protein
MLEGPQSQSGQRHEFNQVNWYTTFSQNTQRQWIRLRVSNIKTWELKTAHVIYWSTSTQQWRPKSSNFCHTKKSWGHGIQTHPTGGGLKGCFWYVCHKPFTVKFPDKCEWQNGFNLANNGARSGTWMGPKPIKALVLAWIDWAQEGSIASALSSTPQYARLKYTLLRLVEWRICKKATQVEHYILSNRQAAIRPLKASKQIPK